MIILPVNSKENCLHVSKWFNICDPAINCGAKARKEDENRLPHSALISN